MNSGLLDLNGKEIKLGDKVLFPYITPFGDIDDFCYEGVIEFKHGSFVLTPTKYDGEKLFYTFNPLYKWCKKEEGKYISNVGNIEVVSNICVLKVVD